MFHYFSLLTHEEQYIVLPILTYSPNTVALEAEINADSTLP